MALLLASLSSWLLVVLAAAAPRTDGVSPPFVLLLHQLPALDLM